MICNQNGAAVLTGVTSWGRDKCGTEGYPGIYGNIYAYLTWIRSVVDFDDADQTTTRNKPTTDSGLLPATAIEDEVLCCEKHIDIE